MLPPVKLPGGLLGEAIKGGVWGRRSPPRVFQGGSGGATPPQVSQVHSKRAMMKTGGGGPPQSRPGGTFPGPGGEGKGGENLILSRFSDP